MKLLAYKPILFDVQAGTISPASNPGWEWPLKNVLTMQCVEGHKVPVDECGCGIQATLNATWAKSFLGGTTEEPPEGYQCSTLAVVQLIGEIALDEQWHVLCQSVYIWGIIKPLWLDDSAFDERVFSLDVKYNVHLARYETIEEAMSSIRYAYVNYTRHGR